MAAIDVLRVAVGELGAVGDDGDDGARAASPARAAPATLRRIASSSVAPLTGSAKRLSARLVSVFVSVVDGVRIVGRSARPTSDIGLAGLSAG